MITTNNHWRDFKYRDEVPAKILADEFDYLDADTLDGFIHYRGYWYHTCDFMRTPGDHEWDGSHPDSAFSGVLIKLSNDGETYQIATWIHKG